MSSASRAVAVTGASGFLGRALCARLVARGMQIRPLVRAPAAFSLAGAAPAARCDLPDVLDESSLVGAHAVVHCAYATREPDQVRARRINSTRGPWSVPKSLQMVGWTQESRLHRASTSGRVQRI